MAQNAADKTVAIAMQFPVQTTGSTLFALNDNGVNLYSMQVQPGFVVIDGVERRLTEQECELIATCIYAAIRTCFGNFWKQ